MGSALLINSLEGLFGDKERSADSSITWHSLANIYIPLRPLMQIRGPVVPRVLESL